MANYVAKVERVITNGPFTYVITKEGVGLKAVVSIATLGAAFNGIRDDIAAAIPQGENVLGISLAVRTDG